MFDCTEYLPTTLQPTMAALDAFLKNDSARNLRSLLKVIILITIAAAAVASRLFSVIRKLLVSSSVWTAFAEIKAN